MRSSTETQPATVSIDDGVLRVSKRTTTTVETTQTKDSTLDPATAAKQLLPLQLTTGGSEGSTPSYQQPPQGGPLIPSAVSTPTPPSEAMEDLSSQRPESKDFKEPVRTGPARFTPDMEADTSESPVAVTTRSPILHFLHRFAFFQLFYAYDFYCILIFNIMI